jgi:hypothetical protein
MNGSIAGMAKDPAGATAYARKITNETRELKAALRSD